MYKPSKEILDQVDESLFVREYEVMLLEDLRVYPEVRMTPFGPLDITDTVEVVESMLNRRKLNEMDDAVKRNYVIMFSETYKILDSICDWNQVKVETGKIPMMKRVYNRLNGLLKEHCEVV